MSDYDAYLASEHWQRTRARIVAAHPYCTCCSSRERLEVHHVSYTHLGCEPDSDLMVLCRRCHRELHRRLKFKYPNRTVSWQTERTWSVLLGMFPKAKRVKRRKRVIHAEPEECQPRKIEPTTTEVARAFRKRKAERKAAKPDKPRLHSDEPRLTKNQWKQRGLQKVRDEQEAWRLKLEQERAAKQPPVVIDPIDSLPTLEERVKARIARRNGTCPSKLAV